MLLVIDGLDFAVHPARLAVVAKNSHASIGFATRT
jgi:hypothetical protein